MDFSIKMAVQKTYIDTSIPSNRSDLNQELFERLISEKGREVILSKVLSCPCAGEASNALSNCKNCGGIGWIWVNDRQTRMVLTGIDVSTKYAPWSEEVRGMVSFTCFPTEELTYFDRIELPDATSVYSQTLKIKQKGDIFFAYTSYKIKEIEHIARFKSVDEPLEKLTEDQYSMEQNIIQFNANQIEGLAKDDSITIRYKYSPTFLIIEFRRETMQSYKLDDTGENQQNLPISGIAKRLHSFKDTERISLAGSLLLNNDYEENSEV